MSHPTWTAPLEQFSEPQSRGYAGVGETRDVSLYETILSGDLDANDIPVSNPADLYEAQNNDIILSDVSAGSKTINLPLAGSSNNFRVDVKKLDSSANTITIDGNGAETIDGVTTAVLSAQYEAISLFCDGGEWHIIGNYIA